MTKRRNAAPVGANRARFRLRSGKIEGTRAVKTQRVFDLQVFLPPYDRVVADVLNALETDEIQVLQGYKDSLKQVFSSAAEIHLQKARTQPASIRRWLTTGCQVIRWDVGEEFTDNDRKRGRIALYTTNAAEVLFPEGAGHRPVGPSAFLGSIIIDQQFFPPEMDEVGLNRLKCVIAHELTHVFDTLKYLVPAFVNWRKCWNDLLEAEGGVDPWREFHWAQGCFLDDYGTQNELSMIERYWPAEARVWFEAFRGAPRMPSAGV